MLGFVIASAAQVAEATGGTTAAAQVPAGVMELKGVEGATFIALVDMTVVFAVLGVIALVMVLLAKAVQLAEEGPRKASAAPSAPTPGAAAAPATDELDEETVAVITAAVAAVMAGKRYRIASLAGYDIQTARWAMAGRQKLLMKG